MVTVESAREDRRILAEWNTKRGVRSCAHEFVTNRPFGSPGAGFKWCVPSCDTCGEIVGAIDLMPEGA
jgi:hypothetical protein